MSAVATAARPVWDDIEQLKRAAARIDCDAILLAELARTTGAAVAVPLIDAQRRLRDTAAGIRSVEYRLTARDDAEMQTARDAEIEAAVAAAMAAAGFGAEDHRGCA